MMKQPIRSSIKTMTMEALQAFLSRERLRFAPGRHDLARMTGVLVVMLTLPLTQAYGGSVTYSYDALGRVVKAVYSGGTSTTIIYRYDATGNRTSVTTIRQ
jgi:YD repeat-containing protein